MKALGRARLIGLKRQNRIAGGKREARHPGISWTKMIPTPNGSNGIEPARLIIPIGAHTVTSPLDRSRAKSCSRRRR